MLRLGFLGLGLGASSHGFMATWQTARIHKLSSARVFLAHIYIYIGRVCHQQSLLEGRWCSGFRKPYISTLTLKTAATLAAMICSNAGLQLSGDNPACALEGSKEVPS